MCGGYSCPSSSPAPTAPATVISVQSIQYKRNNVWTDVPSGGLSPICLGSTISFRAVASGGATWPDGQPVWGGDASGLAGPEQTVTFSTEGSRTVSAAFGSSTVSVSVGAGPANANVAIQWQPASVTTIGAPGNSRTTNQIFSMSYLACADINSNVWRLRLDRSANPGPISGGVNTTLYTGGYRDTYLNPPTSEAEAQDAINVMKGYYTQGRGSWHTASATQAHEDYHYTEWKCSCEHYWPATQTALDNLTAPFTSYSSASDAIAALRSGTGGADAKVNAFVNVAHDYWFTLSDTPPSRPYAAGQLALNNAITFVQSLAASNGWTVPSGTDSPSAANPCYQSWLPYAP